MLCIGCGLSDKFVTHSEESCRVIARALVCVCVCDLGSSTNSHSSPQFGCSTTEKRNINFTYIHSNSNWRLFQAARQCCYFSRVDRFTGYISESAVSVVSDHILMRIPERRDNNEALHYGSLLHPL